MAEITRLKTIAKLLEEELLSPVHGVWLASPKHFQLRPLPLKAGERLMEESGVPEHTTTHTFLDKDEREEWQFVESYCGYWRQHATAKVYYMLTQPGIPQWVMSLRGEVSSRIGDRAFAEKLFDFNASTEKKIFELRRAGDRRFYPRGLPEKVKGPWRRTVAWEGDHRSFSGSENTFYKEEMVWKAHFFGGDILSL